jgi:hypothetical protein
MMMYFFWWTAKTVAGSYMRLTMGEWLVWGQISDPNVRCGARLGGSKSNAVNLILRLFLYHFLHTMSS